MQDALADLLAEEPPADLGPGQIVDRLFGILQAATGASCLLAHETVQIGRRLYFAEVQSVGSAGFRAATAELEGGSLFRYVCHADAPSEEAWPGEINPVDRFGATRRRSVRGLGAWSMYWQPARIRSMLGMTVTHDGHLLGAIAAVRLMGEVGFSRVEIAAARALESGVQRWVAAAWRRRLARCRPPGSRSYLIFDAAGELLSVSRDASPWLETPGIREQLRALARRALGGERVGDAFVLRARVRFEALDGPGRGVLAIVEEGRAHRPGPREKLTDAQRRVADLAVAGATVKEIAADLHRSPETVRDHLKAIYERLGIGSRVELGRVLDPPPPEPIVPSLGEMRPR